MDIETLLSDFRELDKSMCQIELSLYWVFPKTEGWGFRYAKNHVLDVYSFRDYRDDKSIFYPKLSDFSFWKLELSTTCEVGECTSLSMGLNDFCDKMKENLNAAISDVGKIRKFIKKHPGVQWQWDEDEEESNVED